MVRLVKREHIKFYYSRIKHASIKELLYRVKIAYFIYALKKSKRNLQPRVITDTCVNSLMLPPIEIEELYNGEFEKVLRDGICSLCHNTLLSHVHNQYNKIFFSDIDKYNLHFDLRAAWEPARMQDLSLLCLLIKFFDERIQSKIRRVVKKRVLEWIEDNPYPYGLHYISAMECALRIPVFFYCIRMLADELLLSERRLILETIYQHADMVFNRLSLFSSVGNHTIAEATGLVFAGVIFNTLRKGKQWLNTGISLLSRESYNQILADGGPAEQSISYHRFVLDLYWLAVGFLRANNITALDDIIPRIIKGETFLSCFETGSGLFPNIGDSDDGWAIAPDVRPKRESITKPTHGYYEFPQTGYSVFRLGNGVIFTFDHGALGMPPLYNHGHADALSITLSKNGVPFFVDPGTYYYNVELQFRKYFKSTRAHNTVTIDQQDQAVQETSFIWSKPYKAELESKFNFNNSLMLVAKHTGYLRLRNPVLHKRVVFHFAHANFLIRDSFWGKGVHEFELNFHLHPDCIVEKFEWGWKISNRKESIFVRSLNSENFTLRGGETSPIFGWFSPSYGTKQKSMVLSLSKKGSPSEISFLTLICTDEPIELDLILSEIK